MSMFSDVTSNNEVKEQGDSLGGGFLLDSAIYEMEIKVAYGIVAGTGAKAVVVEAVTPAGQKYSTTQWVTSGTAKGGKNYWEDKDGNKRYLPGFENINTICLMTTEKELAALPMEQKTLKIWNKEANAEVPTQVPVLTDLIGKKIYFGVLKQLEDKFDQNQETKVYDVVTGETRETNDLDKIFHYPTKKTISEARGQQEATFAEQWAAKWAGQVKNKAKHAGDKPANGAPRKSSGGTDSKPGGSLFG